MPTGAFITFEGGEGAGKSVQLDRLSRALDDAGVPVLATREPGGCPSAEVVRGLLVDGDHSWSPVGEAFLHCAARAEHTRVTVEPALAAGTWVLSDRFADSTIAYQGDGHGVDTAFLRSASARAADNLVPDLTVVLDLPPGVGLARARVRGADTPYEALSDAFHDRVRQGFLRIAEAEPQRCRIVDARADADTVHAAVLKAVEERFGLSLRGA